MSEWLEENVWALGDDRGQLVVCQAPVWTHNNVSLYIDVP